MSRPDQPPDPTFTLYCPRLGHPLGFAYCRRENLGLPCARCLDCWTPYFRVEEYLRRELNEQEWRQTFARLPRSRVEALMEKISRAGNSSSTTGQD